MFVSIRDVIFNQVQGGQRTVVRGSKKGQLLIPNDQNIKGCKESQRLPLRHHKENGDIKDI